MISDNTDAQMTLQILSPERSLFKGEVSKVTFPGVEGLFTVLPYHAPLIAALGKGVITFTTNPDGHPNESTEQFIGIESGFVEVKHNSIVACVEKREDNPKGKTP